VKSSNVAWCNEEEGKKFYMAQRHDLATGVTWSEKTLRAGTSVSYNRAPECL